ncbi:GH39 family glycosyl hydrolase [Clostridium saccharoperbutylacetonicum]|uniref:GH39 family glycosyl hydrolase n=1 Tax=Clostridium saccharoperbutylacetonicum TaxID=36745 RepID=UPI000983DD04|nr:helix-turn-helix domain-containing protein [Clostridium saccharoperbutylacetonicum]AQR96727.1 beta-xylosidase [Clostridium saccharoperbutylacetonicum]NSB32604.1 beta-xylosidase/AraC-like DNA-binding protein [Clostridium saccharoperbutylacetonicum]
MFNESIVKIDIFKSMEKEKHLHNFLELLYVIKGEVFVKVESNEYIMKKDDLLLINENNRYKYKTLDDTILICISISYIELCKIIECRAIKFNCNSVIDHENDFTKLRKNINNILDSILKNEKKLTLISLQFELIDKLINQFSITDDNIASSNKNKHSNRLNEITNYIYKNYNKQITLNDLANKEFLSVPYLSKFIKEQLGITFTEYLNSIRLNYALEDVINTDLPLTRVALENGFATTFIFNKCFKETFNMTPSEYRKKFKKTNKTNDKNIIEVKEEIESYLSQIDAKKNLKNESTNELKIEININNKIVMKKHYNKIINIGYASDILQSLLQEHILMLRNEIKFEYARFWGIFNEDMNIESKDNEYNFYKIDKILDFIVSSGMKPFIDLMPKAKKISKSPEDDLSLEIEVVKFRTLEEWERLIHKFIVHCINKYGKEEVEKWYFEVSRNENISIAGTDKNENIIYFEIFGIIYNKIKEMLPKAKVGGPGGNFTKSNALDFFRDWKVFKAKPDFISIFIYPYTMLIKSGAQGAQTSSEKNYFLNKLKSIEKNVNNLGYLTDEIIISEWNSTVSNRNYTNDSCSKAAYIIKNVLDSMGRVDKLGYWVVSDISGEYLDTDLLLQGGTGLISKNGIKKPAYYAFSFLERLSENIIQKGNNYIMTRNGNNSFTILCHNYKHFNNSYLLNSEENISLSELENFYEDENEQLITFSLSSIQNGNYRIKSYILNEEYGSVLNEWMKLDTDNHLKPDEIDYLKSISIPKLMLQYVGVSKGVLNYSLKLLPHEVRLITLEIDYN